MVDNDIFNPSPRNSADAEKHSNFAFKRMNEFRKRGQLCDVVVKVDGRVFPAHRVVLAASSDYFGAMFSNGMVESEQLEIELKSVSADVMEALLDFVYTGHVRVSMENVQELLPAASLVQMEGVKAVCSAFLFGQVEASNVLGIRRFAELHSCTNLEAFAKNYAAHNFETVAEFEEFLLMNAEELIELLSREDLHIESEEIVYNAVIRWVYYDEPNRAVHLPNLLNYVRLAIMSVRFLTDVVDNERLIRQSLECRDLVDEAKRFHLRPDLRSQMRQRRFHQRDGGDEYLVVIGGFGSSQSPSDSVEMFNPRTREWSELPNLPISYRYVAACSLGTCVYVIGGFDGDERLNTVGLLDVAQREDGWRWLAPMHYKRGLSAACTHKGLIYVCGGFDGQTRLRALEVYHPKIDEWRVLEEMTTAREGAGLVVADDTLYCLGGYDGFQLLTSMEAFDLRRGTWSQCKPMYMRRSGAGCAVIVDTLYVCGGYGGPEGRGPLHLDTVEAYNTRLAQWTLVANMNVPRCYVGACQLAGRVYVAAGYNGNRLLNTVEAFDPIDNTWTLYEESRMHNERCDTGMCVVRFLSCAEPPATAPAATAAASTSTASVASQPQHVRSSSGSAQMPLSQVVQIVTPLSRSQQTHPHPLVMRGAGGGRYQMLQRPLHQQYYLPESTGAPPIPGQRVLPIREANLAGEQIEDHTETEEEEEDEEEVEEEELEEVEEENQETFLDDEAATGEGEGVGAESEQHLGNDESAGMTSGDGTGTPDVDLAFQHPDGAASDDPGGRLLLRAASSDNGVNVVGDRDREQGESSGDEALFLSAPPVPSQQQQQAQSPGSSQLPELGVILEDIDSHLQHRMVFLRGRESSGSRESSANSLVVEFNPGSQEGTEEAAATVDQRCERPPSPSGLTTSPLSSLLWMQRLHSVSTAPSPDAATTANHNAISPCNQLGDGAAGGGGDEDSRSEGEGEEGALETPSSVLPSSAPRDSAEQRHQQE